MTPKGKLRTFKKQPIDKNLFLFIGTEWNGKKGDKYFAKWKETKRNGTERN